MSSHFLGRALATASTVLLSACQSLSPDGRMSTVAMVAGGGLNKDVVRLERRAFGAKSRGWECLLRKRVFGATQNSRQLDNVC
jgi:hypothetical protein